MPGHSYLILVDFEALWELKLSQGMLRIRFTIEAHLFNECQYFLLPLSQLLLSQLIVDLNVGVSRSMIHVLSIFSHCVKAGSILVAYAKDEETMTC